MPIMNRKRRHQLCPQAELFPSVIRVSALSVSGTCGRVGALIAPALIEARLGPSTCDSSELRVCWSGKCIAAHLQAQLESDCEVFSTVVIALRK